MTDALPIEAHRHSNHEPKCAENAGGAEHQTAAMARWRTAVLVWVAGAAGLAGWLFELFAQGALDASSGPPARVGVLLHGLGIFTFAILVILFAGASLARRRHLRRIHAAPLCLAASYVLFAGYAFLTLSR